MLGLLSKGIFGDVSPRKYVGVILVLILALKSGLTQEEVKELCTYGTDSVPVDIYQRLIGWHCYEEVKDSHPKYVTYVCRTDENVKIPCLKVKGSFLDFGHINADHALGKEFPTQKFEELLDCFTETYNCTDANVHKDVRIWEPGTNGNTSVCSTETRNKFHISLLSISLVLGIPAIIISSYFSWTEEGLTYQLIKTQRNLISAVIFRSFITLLIQSEIILPYAQNSTVNEAGIPALAVFEVLSLNMVLALWLVFAYFVWKSVRSDYTITPSINMFTLITIGISLGVTILWIIVVASTQSSREWLGFRDWDQWINDSVRIIFLLLQVYLILKILLKMLKKPSEGGYIGRRIRLEAVYIFVLTPIFILQFALNAGTPDGSDCAEGFYYTLYFIDGLQGAIVCLFFFYIDSEILLLLANIFELKKITEDTPIRTLDSLKDRPNKGNNLSNTEDVVYSSVVTPERYEKTLQIYNRQNLSAKRSVTMFEGEQFVSCDVDRKISTISDYYDAISYTEFHDVINSEANPPEIIENKNQPRSSITPIHESKFATINKSDSEDKNRIRKNFSHEKQERYSVSSSSSYSSSTSGESIKKYPMATPVRDQNEVRKEPIKLLKNENIERQSMEALKGSSSEESLHNDYHVPYPVPPLRKKKINLPEGTPQSFEERQSYPPAIKVTSPSVEHQTSFDYQKDNVKPVLTDSSTSSDESDVDSSENEGKNKEKTQGNADASQDNKNIPKGNKGFIPVAPVRKKNMLAKPDANIRRVKDGKPTITDSSSEDEYDRIPLARMKKISTSSSSSSSEGELIVNYPRPIETNSLISPPPEVAVSVSDKQEKALQPRDIEAPKNLFESNNVKHNTDFLKSDLDKIDKRLEALIKKPVIQRISTKKSEEINDENPDGSFEGDNTVGAYGSKDIDSGLESVDYDNIKGEPMLNEKLTTAPEKIDDTAPVFSLSASSSSDSSENEEESKKLNSKKVVPQHELVKNKQSPETINKSVDLPNIYDDLKTDSVHNRPKSLTDKRITFSKMFSNHRNKLLSSKSENDFLGTNSAIRKSIEGNPDSLNYEALVSPTEYSKDDLNRGLTSFGAVENLNEAEDLELAKKISYSSYSSDAESDSSVISSDTVKKTKVSPKIVLQEKNDWEPQNVAI